MAEPAEILLVEDYEPDEHHLAIVLRRNRVTSTMQMVHDGNEALDFLFCRGRFQNRNAEQLPKVIFLDVRMPKVGGLEVLRQIKQDPRTRNIPVIIFTGSVYEQELEQARELGAVGILPKPVKFPDLQSVCCEFGFVFTFEEEQS
ncbi:MAG: two-component system response regulator [Pedosphaera sp.]|nr:two-component system response regulator [Pedosphaera sp.]